MGAVYLAEDAAGKKYALKVLLTAQGENEEFKRRFERESRYASALNHPNIVRVHDFGERNGQAYMIMEYVEGRDLASEIAYLAGVAEGAGMAYRMALRFPHKFAGVISMNGTLPRPAEGPLFRDDEVKDLRVLICHGAANEVVPLELARRDFLALYGAGADVLLSTYPCTHTVHPNMLRDINRWVIRNVDYDACWDAEEDDFEE